MASYYVNSCKYYYDTLVKIQDEPLMANKLAIGLEIPEFFYFYLRKYGTKSIPNFVKDPMPWAKAMKNSPSSRGSFWELAKFLTSLEEDGKEKEPRIKAFQNLEPSWYTQELLAIIVEQRAVGGIGAKKLREILEDFEPLRRPRADEALDREEEYLPEDSFVTDEHGNSPTLSPLEEAERYPVNILLLNKEQGKKDPIEFPAMVQKKYDGTRRLVFHTGDNIFFKTRQGKNGLLPDHLVEEIEDLYQAMGEIPFVIDGELYIPGVARAKANGIANTKHENDSGKASQVLVAWDFFTLEEYLDPVGLEGTPGKPGKKATKTKPAVPEVLEIPGVLYTTRFKKLRRVLKRAKPKSIVAAETWEVDDIDQALDLARVLIAEGEEGGVLKDYRLTFKNGRSQHAVKLKATYDCNLVITGLNPGEGKFKGKIGSFVMSSRDGRLQVSVSGMVDEVRNRVDPDYWIGKVISITFLELNPENQHGFYTLHSPQYVDINEDVEEADSLEEIQAIVKGEKVE